jgi:hypothetical protein
MFCFPKKVLLRKVVFKRSSGLTVSYDGREVQ